MSGDLERDIDALERDGPSLITGYAGVFLDGELLCVRVAAHGDHDDKGVLDTLRGILGTREIKVIGAEYSLAQLEETKAMLEAQVPQLRSAGVAITGIGLDTKANRVSVTLQDDRWDWTAEIRRLPGSERLAVSFGRAHYSRSRRDSLT